MKTFSTILKAAVCLWMTLTLSFHSTASANEQTYEVDGIFYQVYGTGNDKEAAVVAPFMSGGGLTTYVGDIVIPSQVMIGEEEYPVRSITFFAFQGPDIKSVFVPNSVGTTEEASFVQVTLDSISLPMDISLAIRTFDYSHVKRLIFRAEDDSSTVSIGSNFPLQYTINMFDTIEVEPCKAAYIGIVQGDIGCLHFRHIEEIWPKEYVFFYCKDPDTPQYFVLDDEVPPVAMGEFADKTTIGGSLLFVPDGTVETYENATFWKTARAIFPQSRLPELETLLSSSGVKEMSPDSADRDWELDGQSLTIRSESPCTIHDIAGRLIKVVKTGETYTLQPGVYILSNGKKIEKISIK